jgi:hypothetical protein
VSRQLHAPAALPPGKRAPSTHWIGGWVNPRAGLDDMERRTFFTLRELELRPLGPPALSQSLYRLPSDSRTINHLFFYKTFGIVKVFWKVSHAYFYLRSFSFFVYIFGLMHFMVNTTELFRLDSEIHSVETRRTQIWSFLANRYYPYRCINKMEYKTSRKICPNEISR